MLKLRYSFMLLVVGVVVTIALTSKLDLSPEPVQVNAVHAAGKAEPKVMLTADQSTTSWNTREAVRRSFELPTLFLHQNRLETEASERTLKIIITGIDGGQDILVEITSIHSNVETGVRHVVAKQFTLPDRFCDTTNACVLTWTMDPQATYSGFYHLRVKETSGKVIWPQEEAEQPSFVMLERWDVDVDEYTVRIMYATLFPFARGQNDYDNRLPPKSVVDFIEHQFVPVIIDTWNTQFYTWGLADPIHPDWDADNTVEIIVTDGQHALYDGIGTYSQLIGPDNQPTRECRIWWSSSNNSFQAYRTLDDAVKAVYAHEFFHLVQRNILLFTENPANRWMNVFIEAQGKFAPSVQYPQMENRKYGVQPHLESEYLDSANRFLTQRLNTSYREMEADSIHKFDAVLYWRFLYEQYGDMQIVASALVEMTQHYHQDIVPAIPTVLNETFAQHQGPFATYEGSLVAFARANYALRFPAGHCELEDFSQCEGSYYDPSHLYASPPLEAELEYDGMALSYAGAIPSSFGMDFIEISIDATALEQSVQITVEGWSNVTQFNIAVWPIAKSIPDNYPLTLDPIDLTQREHGAYSFEIDQGEYSEDIIIALIITRLDAHEREDPNGNYTVRVLPDS